LLDNAHGACGHASDDYYIHVAPFLSGVDGDALSDDLPVGPGWVGTLRWEARGGAASLGRLALYKRSANDRVACVSLLASAEATAACCSSLFANFVVCGVSAAASAGDADAGAAAAEAEAGWTSRGASKLTSRAGGRGRGIMSRGSCHRPLLVHKAMTRRRLSSDSTVEFHATSGSSPLARPGFEYQAGCRMSRARYVEGGVRIAAPCEAGRRRVGAAALQANTRLEFDHQSNQRDTIIKLTRERLTTRRVVGVIGQGRIVIR